MQRKHNGRWIVIQNHDLDAPMIEILREHGSAMHVGVIRTELEERCVFGRYMLSYYKNQIRWRYLVNIRLYWLHEQMCVVKDTKPATWMRKAGVGEPPPPIKKFGPAGEAYVQEYMDILEAPTPDEVSWADREDEVAQATVAQAVEVEASVPDEVEDEEEDYPGKMILTDPDEVQATLDDWAGGEVKKDRRVYVSNYAGHNYTKAESYGELRFITQGYVNFSDRDRLIYDLAMKISDSRPDDYLLLSGHLIVNIVVFHLWLVKHNRCRVMSWSNRWSKYETEEYEVPHMEQVIEITGGLNAQH